MTLFDWDKKRVKLDMRDLETYKKRGSVIVDHRRTRPRWFDGRFLKAADLNRESTYFLYRQADLAVSTGTGVVEGLDVESIDNTRIRINRGHGMTFDGERVFLPKDITINISNIPLAETINAELGLSRRPAPSVRSLSGIFVVALRSLEFTANPASTYPVDVDGRRRMQDGDIVEATAVTLVPYEYPVGVSLFGKDGDRGRLPYQRRARIAHDIFTRQAGGRMPAATLPLAMLDLRRGNVHWVDNHMVRRRMGSVYSDVMGFGFVPRHLRHAHYRQYDEMIGEIVAQRPDAPFAASEYFMSLPSAGRMPGASVAIDSATQYFFPESMDVELSVIPEDELAALIEESLLLPPIPLTGDAEALAAHSVMIYLPVPRHQFHGLTRTLEKVPRPVLLRKKIVRSQFKPIDYVREIRARLPDFSAVPRIDPDALKEAAWKSLVKKKTFLWFVRRRNLSYKDEITGSAVHVMTHEFEDETRMRKFQGNLNLYDKFTHLKVKGSAAADLEMVRLLTIPKFHEKREESDHAPQIMMRAALEEFEDKKKKKGGIDEKNAAAVSERFAGREIGRGIEKIAPRIIIGSDEEQSEKARRLAKTLHVPELDFVSRILPAEELDVFSEELAEKLADPTLPAEDITKFILDKKEELES